MDIVKEISRLPNFGYVFWGDDSREHIAVLGGHSAQKSDTYEWSDSIVIFLATKRKNDKKYLIRFLKLLKKNMEKHLKSNITLETKM